MNIISNNYLRYLLIAYKNNPAPRKNTAVVCKSADHADKGCKFRNRIIFP